MNKFYAIYNQDLVPDEEGNILWITLEGATKALGEIELEEEERKNSRVVEITIEEVR